MAKKDVQLNVVQDVENPIEKNILARAITEISSSMKRLADGGLTHEAIIILTHDACKFVNGRKPTRTEVREVFHSLKNLREKFCKD